MVRFQRLTGCRPGEVCNLRPMDLDRSREVWAFTPASHKTEHHEHRRIIFVGPKAQAVLLPYLLRPADAHCFSPAESVERRNTARRARRKTKVQPSQMNRKKRRPKRVPKDRYTRYSYRQAVDRAIEKANKNAAEQATQKGTDPVVLPHWHPNQLRHTAGTRGGPDAGDSTIANYPAGLWPGVGGRKTGRGEMEMQCESESNNYTLAADAMESLAGAIKLLLAGAWPDPPYLLDSPHEKRLVQLARHLGDVQTEALALCADLSSHRDHLDRLARQRGEAPSTAIRGRPDQTGPATILRLRGLLVDIQGIGRLATLESRRLDVHFGNRRHSAGHLAETVPVDCIVGQEPLRRGIGRLCHIDRQRPLAAGGAGQLGVGGKCLGAFLCEDR
jgi:hypothetical protein